MEDQFSRKEEEFMSDEQAMEQPESRDILATTDSYVTKLVKQTILDAVEKRASDIFIEPLEDILRVRFRIDGLLCETGKYPLEHSSAIISCIKVLSGLDIAEHRFPQDGRFKMKMDMKSVDFRVSVLPGSLGEKVVLRVLDKSGIRLQFDALGFDEESIAIIRRNLKKPYGMILICGPTGSGKTTSLYTCLKFIDAIDVNIVTVEDPIEFQLEGINQVAVQEQVGLSFSAALRSILRQDPDIIMIGEIRDLETADIAVKSSLTGHLVLSTLHTTTATGAVVRFINMGIEPFLVASSCLLTASQALLRILCSHCKQEVPVTDRLLNEFKKFNITVPSHFRYYKPVGCRFCNNIGFLGRLGLIEVLELDSEIRDLLVRKETEITIREAAIAKGMKTLREKALHKVIEGLTTVEEIYRVTTQ